MNAGKSKKCLSIAHLLQIEIEHTVRNDLKTKFKFKSLSHRTSSSPPWRPGGGQATQRKTERGRESHAAWRLVETETETIICDAASADGKTSSSLMDRRVPVNQQRQKAD